MAELRGPLVGAVATRHNFGTEEQPRLYRGSKENSEIESNENKLPAQDAGDRSKSERVPSSMVRAALRPGGTRRAQVRNGAVVAEPPDECQRFAVIGQCSVSALLMNGAQAADPGLKRLGGSIAPSPN